MGPDEMALKDGVMLYYSDDGIIHSEPIPKPPMDYTIPELDLSYFNGLYTVGFDPAEGSDITAYGYIELPHFRNPFYDNDKKISRKKFKKWLMHFPWINRNEAEAYCYLIGITKGRISYSATYHDIAFLINFERPSIVLFNSFIRQLKETEK